MASLIDKLKRDAERSRPAGIVIVLVGDGQGDLCGCEPELVSAFGNLVANAVRYTPAGGTVTHFLEGLRPAPSSPSRYRHRHRPSTSRA
jgi:signal transduction histidine kinase